MPRAEQLPYRHAPVKRAPQRPLRLGFRRRFTPRVRHVVMQVWDPHPVSVASAVALGDLYGRGIAGYAGTISTGSSRGAGGHVADPSVGFAGYAQPKQLFTGWNPGYQTEVGTPIKTPAGLSDTTAASPLDAAMVQITAGRKR